MLIRGSEMCNDCTVTVDVPCYSTGLARTLHVTSVQGYQLCFRFIARCIHDSRVYYVQL